jgi:hypothetical protein
MVLKITLLYVDTSYFMNYSYEISYLKYPMVYPKNSYILNFLSFWTKYEKNNVG